MSALPWPLRALTLAALVILYYKYAKAALFAACRRVAHLLPFARRWDASERGSVLELAAAGASHVLVVVLLVLVTGVDLTGLVLGLNRPDLIALGVAVGVGEVALGSLLCRVLIEGVQAMGRRRSGAENVPSGAQPAAAASAVASGERTRQWLGLSRGGWIRHHLKTMEVISLPLAITLTAVQVGSEEVVFRGLVLTWLRDAGPVLAIGISCLLFTVMQIFLMSSWRAAMFPVVGAIVMGLTHGVLFWHYPLLLPLVVAHVTFFLFAVA
ncbi:CPBP family intramembrane glutamic endopeptidase [Microtetraspora fusca]|uniref:CPBP family intramembrane glutamic endopeptidase n=1 Tax=Microtetraspora fusca TaxID=1997 RepID=UPI000ACB495D|nr:CPBP family intramembrane glutamic endopeptidase [Microtetraspora fusca]